MDKPPEMRARGCADNRAVNRRAGLFSGYNTQSLKRYKHPPHNPPGESLSQREGKCPLPERSCTGTHQQARHMIWFGALAFELDLEDCSCG